MSIGRPGEVTLSLVILINQTIAVMCQFIQHTDAIFPLLYFTVNSSIFAALVAALELVCPGMRYLPGMRASAAVGVVLSAVIFTAVIAPATVTGTWIQPYDDYWVRTATILFHGVAPALVILDYVIHPVYWRLRRVIAWCLGWPLVYLAVVGGLASSGLVRVPYPFLDPAQTGWAVVAVAIAAFATLVVVLATALRALGNAVTPLLLKRGST